MAGQQGCRGRHLLHGAIAGGCAAAGNVRAVLPGAGGAERLAHRPRVGPADAGTGVSGIETGTGQALRKLRRQAHLLVPKMAVWVVQPGLSKALASTQQLHLLAVTELYLRETYAAPFGVIGSP